ncbi:hypothetical protein [Sorangium sp. So ce1078]|uniref:hypothetical protein n=1 Tax=Sorangium sp. So ce1078 TaxID=3133329 RepID=UPI003F5EA33C
MATTKKTTKTAGATKTTKAAGAAKATKAAGAAKAIKAAGAAKTAKAAGAAKTAKAAGAAKAAKAAGAAKTAKAAGSEGGNGPFESLRRILQRHARDLAVVHDTPDNYYLDTRTKAPNGKPLFFGAARAGRAYTSFYLMPVYTNPELLDGISPELKKRMQGKSCFNFKATEPALFEELEALTGRCFAQWKSAGRV